MSAENLTVSRCGAKPQARTNANFAELLAAWRRRVEQRSRLAELDELALRDLGLSATDVWLETRKTPWQS